MEEKAIIAHVDDKYPQRIQTLEEHVYNVSKLACQFAQEFGMGEWGYIAGYYHDQGKIRESFQAYIRKVTGLDLSASWHGEDKSHAYIGAQLINYDIPTSNPILGWCIMGHHGGLDDANNYIFKLAKESPKIAYEHLSKELKLPHTIQSCINNLGLGTIHHLIRMIYSCLVDADFLDTERFISEETSKLRSSKVSIIDLLPKLNAYLHTFKSKKSNTGLNTIRQQIQDICKEKSIYEPGFYSLTVPTGGGKTISSLVWAINHCIAHNKKRVIIAIPYTSIITQTAQILREIFGDKNVLEHHSEVEYDEVHDHGLRKRLILATENWDYPIIVTTNVRLIESMMSNKPSKCRKLHNIANSVVIMDEVQTLPIQHLQPIIDTLSAYQQMFNVSFLFTTASMPALSGEIRWSRNGALRGIDKITELIPKEMKLFQLLKRTQIIVENESLSSEQIAQRLSEEKRVLCVVNTRSLAKDIFDKLPNEGIAIHLSRMMCSAHLKKAIQTVKESLASGTDIIRVVSTQLIEAGVDIDFPAVFRQKSGLDSILQAAGRCNREGKLGIGSVYVFNHENTTRGSIRKDQDSFDSLSSNADLFDPETMLKYFKQLYSRYDNFDIADISHLLYNFNEWMFETAAKEFRIIDDSYHTIYVNYDDSANIIDRIKREGPRYDLMRQLSKYSVSIYDKDFKQLLSCGCIEEVIDGVYFLTDKKFYDDRTGLTIDNHWLEEIIVL